MKIHDVLREEAARGGYTVEQLQVKNFRPRISKLRQYAMWRARKETGRSFKAIGLAFDRDHTTVLHAYQKIEAMGPAERLALPPLPVEPVKPVKGVRMPKWTPEQDAEIRRLAASRLSSTQTARLMGLTGEQVKKRAARLGVRFGRYSVNQRSGGEHRAADARSAELLRQAGVQI